MTSPVVVTSRSELTATLDEPLHAYAAQRVGFVPTMGALHAGHASLMRVARDAVGSGPVVVSIFVNPTQFGPNEDLARYPRTLDSDLELCAAEGVNVVFAPSVSEVYPSGDPQVWVDPGRLSQVLEGRTRPGHFQGVLTVVAKLFGLVRPDVAVFGQKDYQQLALIRRMVADLCFGIEIVGAETQREPDGLAMSSRNRYLSQDERLRAAVLSRALRAAQRAASAGVASALAAAHIELATVDGVDLDYLVITDARLEELPPAPPSPTEGRILIAAKVGATRLIDNMAVTL
jgi:pantoate--beta-alanine ligase